MRSSSGGSGPSILIFAGRSVLAGVVFSKSSVSICCPLTYRAFLGCIRRGRRLDRVFSGPQRQAVCHHIDEYHRQHEYDRGPYPPVSMRMRQKVVTLMNVITRVGSVAFDMMLMCAHSCPVIKQKPDAPEHPRCSIASAYSSTGPPADGRITPQLVIRGSQWSFRSVSVLLQHEN